MLGVFGGDNVKLLLSAPNRAGILRKEEETAGELATQCKENCRCLENQQFLVFFDTIPLSV
jgi:hypothetical protein